MEAYGEMISMIGLAGFFTSIVTGIVYAACKRTLRYTWLFGCMAAFCFFTAVAHIIVLISYDDITSPNYEAYKDWDTFDFILSDVKRLIVWLGIGALNYFIFMKQNKVARWLFIIGGCILAIISLFLMIVLFSVSSTNVDMAAARAFSAAPFHPYADF